MRTGQQTPQHLLRTDSGYARELRQIDALPARVRPAIEVRPIHHRGEQAIEHLLENFVGRLRHPWPLHVRGIHSEGLDGQREGVSRGTIAICYRLSMREPCKLAAAG